MTLKELERRIILTRMVECKGNATHSAKSLGIGIRTLQRKLRQYGIPLGSQEYRANVCLQMLGVKESIDLKVASTSSTIHMFRA